MGQTAEDIRDNIVKITDENGNCVGTGFFIVKEYCVTCHHNIYQLGELYVEREVYNTEIGQQQRTRRYHAEWIEEFSDMQKDIAFLRVPGADFKPLEYRRETYGNIPVVVRGFPLADLYNFPDGKDERGTLTDIPERFRWKEEEIVVESEDGKKKWNMKPEVNVQVYAFNGKFHLGFSGAPVCYPHDWKIVGMFEAKDDNQGYIIPMNIVSEKLSKKEKTVSASSPTIDTEKIIDLGNTYYNKRQYAEAIEQYNIIISDPNYASAWYNKGLSLANLSKHQEAIACYDKALDIDPNYANAWNNKGNALAKLSKYEEAIKHYDKALDIDPNAAPVWNNKGSALAKLSKYEEAIKHYDKALDIDPNYANAWNNKGNALAKLSKYEEAIKHYDKALDIDPGYIDAWYNKGLSLANLSKHQEAIKCFGKVMELYQKMLMPNPIDRGSTTKKGDTQAV